MASPYIKLMAEQFLELGLDPWRMGMHSFAVCSAQAGSKVHDSCIWDASSWKLEWMGLSILTQGLRINFAEALPCPAHQSNLLIKLQEDVMMHAELRLGTFHSKKRGWYTQASLGASQGA